MKAVFAIDPGKTTGLAWGLFRKRKSAWATLSHGELTGGTQVEVGEGPTGYLDAADQILNHLQDFAVRVRREPYFDCDYEEVEVTVVVEDFILRVQQANSSRDMLSPVRMTGILEGLAFERSMNGDLPRDVWRFQLQMPSEAKGFATNDRLKRAGMYDSHGGRHSRDAWRHIATYIAKNQNRR